MASILGRRRWLLVWALVGAVASAAAPARASLVVTDWDLFCLAQDVQGGTMVADFTTVQSPFVDGHQVAVGLGTASARYNVTFDSDAFDFRVDASVAGPGVLPPDSFTSACESIIHISSGATPLLVSVDSSFTWALPGGERDAYISLSISGGSAYYFTGGGGATGGVDPPTGTVTPHGDSILLPANGSYGLIYEMFVDAYSGSPSQLGHGDGYVHFSVHTVPEPCAMLLLGVGIGFRGQLTRRQGFVGR